MFKQIVATVLIAFAILSIYFGSYLPLSKAQKYVEALRAARSSARSISDFKMLFNIPLDFYSPIGNEEVIKFLSIDILNAITQKQPEEINRSLVEYIEPHMFKNDVRHLIILGQMYAILWREYGNKEDYLKSESYQQMALAIGPNLPPVLYGLLDIYQASGDKVKLMEIAKTIVKYWPEDEGVQKVIKKLNGQ
ncbi:MAG: hypothetical protein Q7R98_01985 [Candidatus Jorgensenbacteria bacterium]|nr:hypothetical protein [Candidatus Jorgensenbacteria bacterium]